MSQSAEYKHESIAYRTMLLQQIQTARIVRIRWADWKGERDGNGRERREDTSLGSYSELKGGYTSKFPDYVGK